MLGLGTAESLAAASSAGAGAQGHTASLPAPGSFPITYVSGSTREVCRLTGQGETQTAGTRPPGYGLAAGDRGYSLFYRGKLWFLFGDSLPVPTFNGHNNRNRWRHDTHSWVNDSMAYARGKRADGCPRLVYPRQKTPAVGAYVDPHVIISPGQEVSLRTNEVPAAGIAEHGHMYVLVKTNNPNDACTNCGAHNFGESLTSVMAVLVNPRTLTFRYLYTFSGPAPVPAPASVQPPYPNAGRFVENALADGGDGYVYVWGTTGGTQTAGAILDKRTGLLEYTRHSDVRLARIPVAEIGQKTANGRPPSGVRYFKGLGPGGAPLWSRKEGRAAPLFNDSPPCSGELGVQWTPYINRWVMLYNCLNNTPANPRGIWMRYAPAPWGPWSAPQTIFNPVRDNGYCYFMHSTGTPPCPPGAPNPPGPHAGEGGEYGPYFVAGWTTGYFGSPGTPASATIYYTIDTFVPYGQVIAESILEEPTPGHPPP